MHKPEVRNVSQRRQRRIKLEPKTLCIENLVKKFSRVFPEICLRGRQTHSIGNKRYRAIKEYTHNRGSSKDRGGKGATGAYPRPQSEI